MTRVAALQFASGTGVEENLHTCLRMIDQASGHSPQLMVLPEFCNHISWYDDAAHARAVSLDLGGPFLQAIAARAGKYQCYIVINVTLRRNRGLTVTSLMYGPDGTLCAEADKQTMMGHENTWFERAQTLSPVVSAPFGRLAMFPCRDGVTCETPRGLALRGAQLFCDSLNSFALDEATLHVPVRAPENRVFLAAANKVGPLIPQHLLEAVSNETHIPLEFLYGAGESQIVSPQGEVLARAPREGEAVIWADVELAAADDKRDPDGTDSFRSRRPALYRPVAQEPVVAEVPAADDSAIVACLLPAGDEFEAREELIGLVQALPTDTRLAVLPELALGSDSAETAQLIETLRRACSGRPQLTLCTSLMTQTESGLEHHAVLVDETGLVGRQAQLHQSERMGSISTGDCMSLIDLPWARIALLSADDARHPELVKVAAIEGAHLLVVPGHLLHSWEHSLALPSRAAENRLCVVYCSRSLAGQAGLIADLDTDFTLMTPWVERRFDGYINQPRITAQSATQAVTSARIHPLAATNKLMSERTDLILDRPWFLSGTLVEEGVYE